MVGGENVVSSDVSVLDSVTGTIIEFQSMGARMSLPFSKNDVECGRYMGCMSYRQRRRCVGREPVAPSWLLSTNTHLLIQQSV